VHLGADIDRIVLCNDHYEGSVLLGKAMNRSMHLLIVAVDGVDCLY